MERLTDAQWALIEPHLPKRKPSAKGGRPHVDDRACFEGILWILRSGARWKDLPKEYPSPATCWRRLAEWERKGVWLQDVQNAVKVIEAGTARDLADLTAAVTH